MEFIIYLVKDVDKVGNPVKLTEEQRKLAEDNHKLALHFAGTHRTPPGMDWDEWVSECYLHLVNAARAFDPAKGTFASLAWVSMERGWWGCFRQVRKLLPRAMKDPTTGELFDLDDVADHRQQIGAESADMEGREAIRQVESLVRSLPAYHRLLVRCRLKGETFEKASERFSDSREKVRQAYPIALRMMARVAQARGWCQAV